MKNLIIQYGQCKNNCSYCYLKKQNIVPNKTNFFHKLKTIAKHNIVENVYLSYQNYIYASDYIYILNYFSYSNIYIIINYVDYDKNFLNFLDRTYFFGKVKVYISINAIEYDYSLGIFNWSFFYNSNTHNYLIKILDKSQIVPFPYIGKPIYISIDKFSEINYLDLFELYTKYPDRIELDSCYKRIINNGTCNDIFVLNEDGHIYTCPYTDKFIDNKLKNEMKECPFIKLKRQ